MTPAADFPMMTRDRFASGQTYDQMVAVAKKNIDLWTLTRRRATADDAAVAAVEGLGSRFHLAVLSEDWCIDSVSSLPFIDALAARASNLDLRIFERDKNLDLMDAHLTNATSRSIPVVIVYDEDFVERGWWGPRPSELQAWVMETGMSLDKVVRVAEERRWYAKDRGVSSVREIVELLTRAAAARAASRSGADQPAAVPDAVPAAVPAAPLSASASAE